MDADFPGRLGVSLHYVHGTMFEALCSGLSKIDILIPTYDSFVIPGITSVPNLHHIINN